MPNEFGGREDLEAVAFLKEIERADSRARAGRHLGRGGVDGLAGVSRPTYLGGLGFGFKWNMGWMHDTLGYFSTRPDPPPVPPPRADVLARLRVERELHPAALPRRGRARQGLAAREDAGRPLAAARQPARALRVTCGRIPARSCSSWAASSRRRGSGGRRRAAVVAARVRRSRGVRDLVRDLNHVYLEEPALWEVDFSPAGFRWLEPNDALQQRVRVHAPVGRR